MSFNFQTLSPAHLDQIVALLDSNYLTSPDDATQICYSRDYIYWHLRQVKPGLTIGLCYQKKLVGLVSCLLIPTIIDNKPVTLPYPNLLCIQFQLRKLGVVGMLIKELETRLRDFGYDTALISTSRELDRPFVAHKSILIPINGPKLIQVGFLPEDNYNMQAITNNPLRLLKPEHIPQTCELLNNSHSHYQLRPDFNPKTVHQFLRPKKDIVYSFVKLDDHNNVTDFCSAYISRMKCRSHCDIPVVTGTLSFIVAKTVDVTSLIRMFLDKLKSYGVDQLMYQDWGENKEINVTRFTTEGDIRYYLIGRESVSNLVYYPF